MPVRVRFAPSPTGFLHIGGARTALFNWLWARQQHGVFVLRIEDTDQERSSEQSVQAILDGMKWMGLDWDEGPGVGGPHGPYFQMQRLPTYDRHAESLIAKGKAYRCDCTREELERLRAEAAKAKRGFKYPGTCRDKGLPRGTPGAVVRFRMPESGETRFDDLVKGEIATQHKELQDEVILRADGVPLYNFGAVVDDIEMQITMVARGDDHVVNTPRQILMYQALDYPVPAFAHLPMILGADKQRLSKRHGAVSVLQYRDDGYLPGALLNYLALLGWGPEDGREVLSVDELIAEFDLARVNPSAATFDPKKLEWMNAEHIRRLTHTELQAAVLPFARARYGGRLDIPRFEKAVVLAQERATTLVQIADQMAFLFVPDDELEIDPASWEKIRRIEQAPAILDAVIAYVETCPWDLDAIDLKAPIEALGLKAGKAMPVIYTAIEGRAAGLPVYDSIFLLGREPALRRLRAARAKL